MKKLVIPTTIVGIIATGALAVAPMATGAPTGGSNAADTVKTLRDKIRRQQVEVEKISGETPLTSKH